MTRCCVEGDVAAPLAETIREKTGGNPFFMRQFLQKLQTEGLLDFDAASGTFRCDLDAIRSLAITENVADLIAQKIGRLDAGDAARGLVRRRDRQSLRSRHARERGRVHAGTRARTAVGGGAREPAAHAGSADENSGAGTATSFQHDRVQQAAYALVPAAARPALNLNIGRAMLAAAGDDVSGQLFEIVNHMNQGIALIDSRAERLRLAKLNLLAATRARNSTAYDLATRACRSAIELLGWDAWGENYALAFEAHAATRRMPGAAWPTSKARCASIDSALPNARTAADKGRLLTVRTHTYLSMGDMTGAVACGRQAAQLFGLDLPEQPELVREQLQSEIGAIIAWSNEHSIESLLELPPMTDPDRMALMSLLMHCIPPAYQVNPELFALICCKMVSLSIEHGNCPMSAKGYGSFAAILSGIVGNFRDGDRFGKLGVDLCERLNDVTVRSACHFTWAAFASAWVRPIDESIEVFREGVRWGLASGDHPHAAYCAAHGHHARHVPRHAARAPRVQGRTRRCSCCSASAIATNIALLRTRRRFTEWLRERRQPQQRSTTTDFDEAATLRDLQATSVSKSMLAQFQSLRVMHRYFAGEYAEAWKISQQLDELLMFVPGMMTVVEHAFFQCLSATALWHAGSRLANAPRSTHASMRSCARWKPGRRNCPRQLRAACT